MTTRRRIFLAHAREDKLQVRQLYDALKARRLDPWLDAVDLMPGQIWKTEIPKAIHQAEIFLACLSTRSVEKRGYVQREFRLALSAYAERPSGSIYLVPVRLDDCDVPDLDIPDLGLNLRDIHSVDLWEEGGFDRLVGAIELALGERTGTKTKAGTVLRDVDEPWCPELVILPPGHFMMGSSVPERRWSIDHGSEREWADWEKPQHRVTIPAPFAVGKHLATRGQFAAFIAVTGHDMRGGASADWCALRFEQRDQHPMVYVNWDDAKAYVAWLSDETGQLYRLPSEAEWEYACRGGTTTRYSWGDKEPTPEQANFGKNVAGTTTEVGSYRPNPWGLYDMHGNVWEWCADCWNENYQGAPSDGSAWESGDCSRRVLRGGCWFDDPRDLRSANRVRLPAGSVLGDIDGDRVGLRVVRTLR